MSPPPAPAPQATASKNVSADGGALTRTILHLWPFIWPHDRTDLQRRVAWAMVLLVIANWWQAGDHGVFAEPGDHAGALETAAVLHVAPHLVAPRETWGDGQIKQSVLTGVRAGWAWTPRRWTQVTADTGVGNPREATAEQGARFVAQAVEQIAQLCEELAVVDAGAMYR